MNKTIKTMKIEIIIRVIILIPLILSPSLAGAQSNVTGFLQFGQENAATFTSLYLGPMGNSLGNNLNNGWFNTGQAHRLGRFDFRLSIPVTFVSEPERYFTFNESDFSDIQLVNPDENQAPTLFGENDHGPAVSYLGEQAPLPPGIGYNFFPAVPPVLQFNLGLVKDTEIMFRYVPEINVRGFSSQLIGFGLKHGVKQYIPGIKYLPFDLSLIMAWSKFNAGYGLNYNPQNDPAIDTDLQRLDISATAMNFNLIASKKLAVITFFGGVRYMYSDTGFAMTGDYPVATSGTGTDIILTDPLMLNMKGGQLGLNGGFRLKFGLISFFADGTLARYSSINAGMSLGFHN
jgi:hypothetical protein